MMCVFIHSVISFGSHRVSTGEKKLNALSRTGSLFFFAIVSENHRKSRSKVGAVYHISARHQRITKFCCSGDRQHDRPNDGWYLLTNCKSRNHVYRTKFGVSLNLSINKPDYCLPMGGQTIQDKLRLKCNSLLP